ncbi:MAG TPA: hypothetical protein DIU26_03680 [Sutterellaceae bacterium]|nr:hypothetical protein [Sutterellaceae bacterium]
MTCVTRVVRKGTILVIRVLTVTVLIFFDGLTCCFAKA